MALWDTDRLCSRWGSGDEVLKLLRNQHVLNTRLTSTERLGHTRVAPFVSTLRFGTVASTVASTVSDSTMGCVCFLTGAKARLALPQVRLTQFLFLLEAVPRDCMLVVLGSSHRPPVAFSTWKQKTEFSLFPTALRFLLPPLGAFPTLRFRPPLFYQID
jgi:hypothetical protein